MVQGDGSQLYFSSDVDSLSQMCEHAATLVENAYMAVAAPSVLISLPGFELCCNAQVTKAT